MDFSTKLIELRKRKGLTQEGLAAKLYVTLQAVSRWETGETVPNTETLKLLSKLFYCFHKHTARRASKAHLPVLRHAA